MLRFLMDQVRYYLKTGMSSQEAIDRVSEEWGISKDGKVYRYLLSRQDMDTIKEA